MTNTTPYFWSVNGVSLQTYAFNITSWGDKQTLPPTRGANLLVPMQPGQTYVPKIPDSRTLTLNMWVTGANPDGSIPRNPAALATFQSNYAALQNLFWSVRQQMQLSQVVQYPDGTTHTVTALAEYAGGMQPTMQGQSAAIFSVDLLLADPFFYGPTIATTLGSSTTINVVGDDRTDAVTLTLTGARNTLRVQNSTPTSQPYFTYNYSTASGDSVLFDVMNFKVTHTPSGGASYQAAGRISHGADPFWLFLNPGNNTIAVSSTSGTGTVSLSYQPRWF